MNTALEQHSCDISQLQFVCICLGVRDEFLTSFLRNDFTIKQVNPSNGDVQQF